MNVRRKPLAILSALPATVSILFIHLYQKTLSPDHGPLRHLFPYGFCRHEPTCSEYGIDVLKKRNYFVALALIVKRIAGCNPWTKPTDDRLRKVIERTGAN